MPKTEKYGSSKLKSVTRVYEDMFWREFFTSGLEKLVDLLKSKVCVIWLTLVRQKGDKILTVGIMSNLYALYIVTFQIFSTLIVYSFVVQKKYSIIQYESPLFLNIFSFVRNS